MNYSLSEIDAMSKRAARGAGLDWGYAEEAAKAVRWLAAHQLPGVAVLVAYLDQIRQTPDRYRSAYNGAAASDVTLCPLKTGAHLCDLSAQALQVPVNLAQLNAPLLLVPYIAQLAQANHLAVKLHWSGVTLICNGNRLQKAETENLNAPLTDKFYGDLVLISEQGDLPGAVGQDIEAHCWQAMGALAQHIYVPASETSRLGAGPAN